MDPRVVLVVVAALGLVVLFVALVVRQRRRLREAFQGFASARGLAFQPGSFPCAHGEVGGRRVYVGNEMGRKLNDVVQFVVRI